MCVSVCACIYVIVCLCVFVYAYLFVCISVYACVSLCVHSCVCIYLWSVSVCVHVYGMCVCVSLCVHVLGEDTTMVDKSKSALSFCPGGQPFLRLVVFLSVSPLSLFVNPLGIQT